MRGLILPAIMGIDIGGSGVKAAPVEPDTGELLAERHRVDTPRPATPSALLSAVGELVDHFEWSDPVGCAFPGVVRSGTVCTAANLDPTWIGVDLPSVMDAEFGLAATVVNDADAAGIAELRFGPSEMADGTVVVCTLGTGIGTAIFTNGHLVSNTEFGHLDIRGTEAEKRSSARARTELDLSWKKWSKRLTEFLQEMEKLLWPDLFVIGGGVSKKFAKYCNLIDVQTPVVPATLGNTAGIVGAALAAEEAAGGY
jgi:polyphosphate glucokinase